MTSRRIPRKRRGERHQFFDADGVDEVLSCVLRLTSEVSALASLQPVDDLLAGLICNFLIKPVDHKWNMSPDEVARYQAELARNESAIQHGSFGIGRGGLDAKSALFWAFVGVPLAWGVWKTLESAVKIF